MAQVKDDEVLLRAVEVDLGKGDEYVCLWEGDLHNPVADQLSEAMGMAELKMTSLVSSR